jgi:tetratricopeptide (TPR) repeat protein
VAAVLWARSERSPDRVYQRAAAAYLAGKYREAENGIKRLEALRSPTYFDRLLRGLVASALEEPDKAVAELATIPDNYPLAPLAQIAAGQTELRRGRTRPAEAAFLTAVKLAPYAVQARRELAYIYNVQHRQIEMEAQLGALSELQTLTFQYILHWSKTRNLGWSPKKDIETLEKFLQADPDDRWTRLALVEGFRRLDRLEEAEKLLAALPESDPDSLAARAAIALDRAEFDTAVALLARGPRDNPALARLRGQLAMLRHDAPGAIAAYRVVHAADPLDRSALYGLGTSLHMIGDDKAAEPFLAAARGHDAIFALIAHAATDEGERDPKVPYQMGSACAAVGRIAEARAWLKLAIDNDPTDTQAQEALFRLKDQGGSIQRVNGLDGSDSGSHAAPDLSARGGTSAQLGPERSCSLFPQSISKTTLTEAKSVVPAAPPR